MRALRAAGLAVAALACSPVASGPDDVIALEIRSPTRQTIALGDSTQLDAVALNGRGEVAPDAQVLWAILDLDTGTVAITLDTLSGLAVGVQIGATRVQARVENLRSDPLTITVSDSTTTPAVRRERSPTA